MASAQRQRKNKLIYSTVVEVTVQPLAMAMGSIALETNVFVLLAGSNHRA